MELFWRALRREHADDARAQPLTPFTLASDGRARQEAQSGGGAARRDPQRAGARPTRAPVCNCIRRSSRTVYRTGTLALAGRRRPHYLLGGVRQPSGQAGRHPSRRPWRWLLAQAAPLPRTGQAPHHPLRTSTSAAAAAFNARRLPRGEHDLGPRGRHRAAAVALGLRELAGLRRLVGQHARPRLRRHAPTARERARAARHLPRQEGRAR
eukprot:5527343-Prymnesium_polylepis.1